MLEACPIWDALITPIPADEPLCGNAAVYAVIININITSESDPHSYEVT